MTLSLEKLDFIDRFLVYLMFRVPSGVRLRNTDLEDAFFQSETEKSLTDKTSAFTEGCLLMFFERKENSKYFLPSNEITNLILETNCFIFTEVRRVFFCILSKIGLLSSGNSK
jgi:hypothetical protein